MGTASRRGVGTRVGVGASERDAFITDCDSSVCSSGSVTARVPRERASHDLAVAASINRKRINKRNAMPSNRLTIRHIVLPEAYLVRWRAF